MTYGEFKSQIENAYKQRFPNSGISITLGALGEDTCFIRLYLGENQSEFINGIAGNDILHVGFAVYQNEDIYGDNPKLTDDLELPDTLIMKVYQNSITTIPDNPYMTYGSVSLPYRKTKGSPEKILQVFSKDVDILKQTLENLYKEGKIHDNHKEIVEKKLGISNVNESIEFRSKTKKLLESFQKHLNEDVEEDNFIKQCEESGQFYNTQMEQIREGFKNGLSMEQVQVYAKKNFNWEQMQRIRESFEEGLSIEQVQVFAKSKFNVYQMYEIKKGFENGLSIEEVQTYAKPEFNDDQMEEIRRKIEIENAAIERYKNSLNK